MQRRIASTLTILLLAAAWITGIVAGSIALWRHQSTPGPAAAAPATWPGPDGFTLRDDAPTLLLFAHPRCPCTRATIEETARIMAGSEGRLEMRFVFRVPVDADDAWTDSASWRRAAAIPGAATIADAGGALHEAFGVRTSGHALLYSADGSLLFSGGVTGGRGHEGGNPGRSAVVALLAGDTPRIRSAPVYGCPLVSEPLGAAR